MDLGHLLDSSYPIYDGLGSLRPHGITFDFEPHRLPNQYLRSLSFHVPVGYPPGMLPAQRTATHDPVGTSSARDKPPWHVVPVLIKTSREYGLPVCDEPSPTGTFLAQPQVIPLLALSIRERANEVYFSSPIRPVQKGLCCSPNRALQTRVPGRGNHKPTDDQLPVAWPVRRPTNSPDVVRSLRVQIPSGLSSMARKESVSRMR